MIREIVRPKDRSITIDIPEDYVGRRVEYIIFPLEGDELTSYEKMTAKSISSLRGALQKYADPSKIDLEDRSWELYIQKKYKDI